MIVVILVVGGIGYFALNGAGAGNKTTSSCAPAKSQVCSAQTGHDVTLFTPYGSPLRGYAININQGSTIPVTASVSSGAASSFTFNWGDGTTTVTPSPTASHAFNVLGTYIISVTAVVNGAVHDSAKSLILIQVIQSYASASSGNLPTVVGQVTGNGSASANPVAIFNGQGSVSVSGSFTQAPTNPSYSYLAPSITSSGGTQTTVALTNTSAAATYSFGAPGVYWITFVGPSSASGQPTVYQNYTWTVYVGPTGVNSGPKYVTGTGVSTSPHKGSLNVYELAPGGGATEDPAVDYDTVGAEPIYNIYQTLIAYNGSLTGPTYTSYVPQLATCVPGSPQCKALYGNSLIYNGGQYYTFVLDHTAQFFNNGTGDHWGVYPSDVMFSIARTLSFATVPFLQRTAGWILGQSLLNPGNFAYDGGIHAPQNNTPSAILDSMYVNNTAYCPAVAMSQENGCITFNAFGSGHIWPYFLELIADPLGGSIVPAGWFSNPTQAAAIPGWYASAALSGDHPTLLPGNVTTTSSPAFAAAVTAIGDTGWDTYQKADLAWPATNPKVQWNELGSGPYYLKAMIPGVSYTLAANTFYHQPEFCAYSGCEPAPGKYAGNVAVSYETTQTPGEDAYQAGVADFASIPSTDVATLLALIQAGKIGAVFYPSISIFFFPFVLNINIAVTKSISPNPTNIGSTFFAHNGLREFLVHAYPYTTIENTIQTVDGIVYNFNYGGAIPQYMANYYPTNISFPSTDPDLNPAHVGGAAWWWQQVSANTTSPYYSSVVAACTSSNPCTFPLIGQTGAPALDEQLALFVADIKQISGGAIDPTVVDVNFNTELGYLGPPGTNPMPFYNLGWAPDYPDPTDYVNPLYTPDNSYTAPDAVFETLNTTTFNASGCHTWTDYSYWSRAAVADTCQGAAYASMNLAFRLAAVTPAGPARVLLYNMGENIANSLALYVYWGQANYVAAYASWINGATIDQNVTVGGAGDLDWFFVGGNGVY